MEKIIIESQETPEYTFIWLHGLGASGHDLEPLAKNIPISWKKSIKHLLPHAPEIPVTINGGTVMPAWYDIVTLSKDVNENRRKVDVDGIENSTDQIQKLVESEMRQGIEPKNIYIIGFSQGGVIASYFGLTTELEIGGIIGLSTYLPFFEEDFKTIEINKKNPFFIAHGKQDSVIEFEIGKRTHDILLENKINSSFFEYEMDHGICEEEYLEFSTWIQYQNRKNKK